MIIRNNIEKRLTILSKRTFANIIVRSVGKGIDPKTVKKLAEAVKSIPPVTPPPVNPPANVPPSNTIPSSSHTSTTSSNTTMPKADTSKLHPVDPNTSSSIADKVSHVPTGIQRPWSWIFNPSNIESTSSTSIAKPNEKVNDTVPSANSNNVTPASSSNKDNYNTSCSIASPVTAKNTSPIIAISNNVQYMSTFSTSTNTSNLTSNPNNLDNTSQTSPFTVADTSSSTIQYIATSSTPTSSLSTSTPSTPTPIPTPPPINPLTNVPKTTTIVAPVNIDSMAKRSMASVHGGTFKMPSTLLPTEQNTAAVPEGDYSGFHKVVTVVVCAEPDCIGNNCGNQDGEKPAPCNVDEEKHIVGFTKEELDRKGLQQEVIGNTTKKIPQGKTGVIIDSTETYSGKPGIQEVVIESQTIPVDLGTWTEDPALSAYLQKESRHNALIQVMPKDSISLLPKEPKDMAPIVPQAPNPSQATSTCDTAKDEEIFT